MRPDPHGRFYCASCLHTGPVSALRIPFEDGCLYPWFSAAGARPNSAAVCFRRTPLTPPLATFSGDGLVSPAPGSLECPQEKSRSSGAGGVCLQGPAILVLVVHTNIPLCHWPNSDGYPPSSIRVAVPLGPGTPAPLFMGPLRLDLTAHSFPGFLLLSARRYERVSSPFVRSYDRTAIGSSSHIKLLSKTCTWHIR